jgi:Protein of unknown function (DUF2937)
MRWYRPLQPLGAAVEKVVDRALCVLGAALAAQLPEFMQQYLQRLGGHLDEARRQLAQFQAAASASGLTLHQLIADTSAQRDPAVARLGSVIAAAAARVAELAAEVRALRGASLWARPFVFLRNLDWGIARATWADFRPAVPTTAEGLVYAAAGLLLALGLYHGLVRYPAARIWRARTSRREAASS